MENKECPSIQEFFKGKCVLVTGATGFLGKVLLEKLLHSCPGIREVIILLRPDDSGGVQGRLHDLVEHNVFQRLRNEQNKVLGKIRPVPGDVTLENLGLQDGHLERVKRDVSIIFHCAANVRFDDEPSITLNVNLVGVKNVLDVCRQCKQLEAFVHTSTAFCFCNQPVISEETFPELVKPEQIIECLKWAPTDLIRQIAKHYSKDRPSVYHFSKAMAETLIVDSDHSIPAAIVRPAIVTAAIKEPFPGWIDNHNGPSGFIALCGKGIIRTLLVKPGVKADWVPVDIVANTLIVAAHHIAVKSKRDPTSKLNITSGVPIINCTCPEAKLITWEEVIDICLPFLIMYPSIIVFGKPGGTVTSSPTRYFLCRLMSHYLPAIYIDITSIFLFRKLRMVRVYNKIHRVMGHLEHYTTHAFTFQSQNMRKLVEQMHPEDAKLFPIDQSSLDWSQYMENYVLGVRKFYLKESEDNLPEARKKMIKVQCFWFVFKVACVYGILYMIQTSLQKRWFFRSAILPSPFVAITYLPRKIASLLTN